MTKTFTRDRILISFYILFRYWLLWQLVDSSNSKDACSLCYIASLTLHSVVWLLGRDTNQRFLCKDLFHLSKMSEGETQTKPYMRSSYNIPLTSLIKMLKFCLQGKGLKGKRVATLTEIENRNATTSGTVTSSRMVYGLA